MTIGVAYSTTPAGTAALRLAAREASIRQTELAILHLTGTPESAADEAVTAAVRAEVQRILPAPQADSLSWTVISEATQGSLADALLDMAERADVEILVIGSRRRSPVGKLVMGSTVREVLLDATMPVLVTKP